jgi:hypothetical protein
MAATTGWRIYDPLKFDNEPGETMIVDEFRTVERNEWTGQGATEAEAKSNVPYSREALSKIAYLAGQNYALRVSPTWLNVNRSYFTKAKANPDMKAAHTRVRFGDWLGAAAIWKKLANESEYNVPPKVISRAVYNLAVANETQGKLHEALEWAEMAAFEYNNKRAVTYVGILKNRLSDKDKLNEQMKDAK